MISIYFIYNITCGGNFRPFVGQIIQILSLTKRLLRRRVVTGVESRCCSGTWVVADEAWVEDLFVISQSGDGGVVLGLVKVALWLLSTTIWLSSLYVRCRNQQYNF